MALVRARDAIPLLLALSLVLGLGAGCNQVFGLDEVELATDDPNAYLCSCVCFEGDNIELRRQFETCVPPSLNPNTGGGAPTPSALASDCNGRVRDTLVGILSQCGSNTVRRRVQQDPSECACAPQFVPTFVDECNGDCQSIALASDCSNQDVATSVSGVPPVCLAEPSPAGQQAMGRALFGDRSTCEVSGTLSVVRGDDDPVTAPASGVVEVAGTPCPGAGCDVELFYRLEDGGDLSFDSYAGFAGVTFRDIRIVGGVGATSLDGAGNGEIAVGAMDTSGRGTREEEVVFGTISDTITRSYVATNVEPVSVGVDWIGRQCAVVGTLIGAEVEGAATDVVVDVLGTVVNQPPTANGGPDRDVECTSPAGATVALSDALSSDPDGNIVLRDWWIGNAGGTEIADAEGDGEVSVAQAIGTRTYVLGVTDAAMSVSHDAVTVRVVDTTAPAISALSASPALIRPRNHAMVPVTVSVSATDVCGTASCEIVNVVANQPLNDLGDGDTDIDWRITGALTVELRAETAGLLGDRIYTIVVACGDGLGNVVQDGVEVRVRQSR